jgi:hypothetical protein
MVVEESAGEFASYFTAAFFPLPFPFAALAASFFFQRSMGTAFA